jgi:hypothetical protein
MLESFPQMSWKWGSLLCMNGVVLENGSSYLKLEHPQPSPYIRALQRGDTGSKGVCWMLQGHLVSWGNQPSLGIAHWEGLPNCHGGNQCHPIIVQAPPLPYCTPTLSLPPPPSPVSTSLCRSPSVHACAPS